MCRNRNFVGKRRSCSYESEFKKSIAVCILYNLPPSSLRLAIYNKNGVESGREEVGREHLKWTQ